MPNAMNTIMMGLATVAAERPISPMACPRKMESMTLYAPLTSMPRMAGMANSVMSMGMDAVPIRLTFSSRFGFLGSCPRGAPVLSSLRLRGNLTAAAAAAILHVPSLSFRKPFYSREQGGCGNAAASGTARGERPRRRGGRKRWVAAKGVQRAVGSAGDVRRGQRGALREGAGEQWAA